MAIQASKFSMWVLAIALLTQNLVMATTQFENQKNYYSPHPHHGTPPTVSHGSSPPHHHGGTTTPSHGGGGYGGGTPPSHSAPTDPSPGNCGTPPTHVPTPSNPPSGGGGYYPSPSPPTSGGSPPTTPYVPTPSTPSPPSTPYVPTPSTPYVPTPSTPTTPSPPYVPVDPNSPFSCNYWRNHPGIVWGLVGWWGTVGNAFGVTSLPGIGSTSSSGASLQQLLSNTRSDGYGTLYREGTASLLNSMVTHKFPFTTMQVRDRFISALSSNKAAAAQGHLFKMANDGKLKA